MGQSSPRLAGAMGGADLRSKLGGTIGFEASRAGPHNGRTLTDCPTRGHDTKVSFAYARREQMLKDRVWWLAVVPIGISQRDVTRIP